MVVEDVFKSKLTHTPVGPDLWRKEKKKKKKRSAESNVLPV